MILGFYEIFSLISDLNIFCSYKLRQVFLDSYEVQKSFRGVLLNNSFEKEK